MGRPSEKPSTRTPRNGVGAPGGPWCVDCSGGARPVRVIEEMMMMHPQVAYMRLERLREMHVPKEPADVPRCAECAQPWPCRTAVILEDDSPEGR